MWAKNKQHGFTIVELLIVIVVIAILAAITIVAFNGIQDRARASAASQALSNAAKKIKYWQAEQDTTSAPDCTTFSGLLGVTPASCSPTVGSTSYQYTQDLGGTYCITATVGNKSWNATGTNSTPVLNGCAGHGVGGVEAVVNYALNPNAAGTSAAAFSYAGTPAAATRVIASDRSHSGSTSLKTSITATGQTGAQMRVPASTLRINTGEKISWSFWIYSTKAGSIVPYIDASRVSDGVYVGGAVSAASVPANAWTKVSATFTSTVDMYISQIGGYNLSVVSGDTTWFDEFTVTKTDTVQNYADGDSADWVWNGPANNATSTGPPL